VVAVRYSLDEFAQDMQSLLGQNPDQSMLFERGSVYLETLLHNPDAVPEKYQRAAVNGRRKGRGSFVLHRSPGLLVTSVVWGPGSHIGPHDHRTWGMIGVFRNGIQETRFDRVDDRLSNEWAKLEKRRTYLMRTGEVSLLVPDVDEIHQLDNFSDRPTVEIHVYGGELGEIVRCQYNAESGEIKTYKSGKFDNC
jgi:predicted metal-dependent enzyme (double-stranded beta helix superfamily)